MHGCGLEMDLRTVDLTAKSLTLDPHAQFEQFLSDGRIHWNDSLEGWVITHHGDIKALLKDPRVSVEKMAPFAAHTSHANADVDLLSSVLADWMVFRDPPRHTALRKAMQSAFLARDIPNLEPQIAHMVARLLDEIAPPGRENGQFDLVEKFAYPLPANVIAALFGLGEDETPQLKAWSDDVGKFVLSDRQAGDRRERAARALRNMIERFSALVEERKRHRERFAELDFTSLLIRDGAQLSNEEIVHTMALVLFAGHETTANLIANAAVMLATDAGLLERLRAEPELVAPAVEEFLRLEGPVQMLYRLARADIEIDDVRVRAGERMVLILNAANRDPAVFECPHELDLHRGRNRHVSFGPGLHMCLGAPLARLEGRLAIEGLLGRFSRLELDTTEIDWRTEVIMHGPRSLPIRYTRTD
jgi:cytochrome P450